MVIRHNLLTSYDICDNDFAEKRRWRVTAIIWRIYIAHCSWPDHPVLNGIGKGRLTESTHLRCIKDYVYMTPMYMTDCFARQLSMQ